MMAQGRDKHASRWGARRPAKVGDLLSRVLARYDFGATTARRELEEAWAAIAGDRVAGHTKVGSLRRGTLEILVDSSVLLQQLDAFQKHVMLAELQSRLQHNRVTALRFRR